MTHQEECLTGIRKSNLELWGPCTSWVAESHVPEAAETVFSHFKWGENTPLTELFWIYTLKYSEDINSWAVEISKCKTCGSWACLPPEPFQTLPLSSLGKWRFRRGGVHPFRLVSAPVPAGFWQVSPRHTPVESVQERVKPEYVPITVSRDPGRVSGTFPGSLAPSRQTWFPASSGQPSCLGPVAPGLLGPYAPIWVPKVSMVWHHSPPITWVTSVLC